MIILDLMSSKCFLGVGVDSAGGGGIRGSKVSLFLDWGLFDLFDFELMCLADLFVITRSINLS